MNISIFYRLSPKAIRAVFAQVLLWAAFLFSVRAGDGNDTAMCELPVMTWKRFCPDVVVKDYNDLFKNTPGTGYDTTYRVFLDSTDTPSSYFIAERQKEIVPIECPHNNPAYLSSTSNRDSLYFEICTGFDSSEYSGTLPKYLHLVGNDSRKYSTGMPYAEIGSDVAYYLGETMKDDIGIWFASSAKYNVKFKESVIKESATPFQQKVIDAIIRKEMRRKDVVRMTGDSSTGFTELAIGIFPLGRFEDTMRIVVNFHYMLNFMTSETYVFDFGENGCVYERVYSHGGDFGAAWFLCAYDVGTKKKPDIIVLARPDRAGYCRAITFPLSEGYLGNADQYVVRINEEDDY
ncbi:MAG: hypothetical protein ACLFVQ_05875 [Chitinispirillaceae bacterium]